MQDESKQSSDYQPPEASIGDTAYLVAKAAIASIPGIGGAGAELFAALVLPPLERRRNEWMREVGDALRKLEQDKGINLESLVEDDIFLDTVLTASQIAVRTSQEEKKNALRNAILNAAQPHAPEESRQQFFLHLVDTFTVWHLRLLKLFSDPVAWYEKYNVAWPNVYMGSTSKILEAAYPELQNQRDFYDQVWKDLNANGLVGTDSLHTMMTESGLRVGRLTGLGRQFLAFIESA